MDPKLMRVAFSALLLVLLGAISPGGPVVSAEPRDVFHATARPAQLQGADVEGLVIDKSTGAPIPNAQVSLQELSLAATTDPAGRFSFGKIPIPDSPHPVTITIAAKGYGTWTIVNVGLIDADRLILSAQLAGDQVIVHVPSYQEIQQSRAEMAVDAGANAGAFAGTFAGASAATLPSYFSNSTPPPTIRVRVTGSTACDPDAPYTVETVDLKHYVKHVLPNEWLSTWHSNSLRAGAMAAKTYAWYWVNRGGKWPDADVFDSTCDQVYNPAVSYASTDAAVDATWDAAMTYNGQIFHASYRAYESQCPTSSTPGCLGQWESQYLAQDGWSWQDILKHFYAGISIAYTGETCCACLPVACCAAISATAGQRPPDAAAQAVQRYREFLPGGRFLPAPTPVEKPPDAPAPPQPTLITALSEADARPPSGLPSGDTTEPVLQHVDAGIERVTDVPVPTTRSWPAVSVPLPSSAGYSIARSAFGMGGGLQTSTSYQTRGSSGQPFETTWMAGANHQVRTGFWVASCAALADFATPPGISTNGGAATLSWPAVTGATSYRIYRDSAPNFTPGTPFATTADTTWSDPEAFGDPAAPHFYIVRPANACGEGAADHRMAKFAFQLTPGD